MIALQSIHKDVSDGREMVVVLSLTRISTGYIEEVFHIAKGTVVHIDILHEATTVWIGFDKDATLAIASIITVFYDNVSYSRRHLATDDLGVLSLELAVADNDIL